MLIHTQANLYQLEDKLKESEEYKKIPLISSSVDIYYNKGTVIIVEYHAKDLWIKSLNEDLELNEAGKLEKLSGFNLLNDNQRVQLKAKLIADSDLSEGIIKNGKVIPFSED